MAWNKVTGNRYTCPALVNTVMNFEIPLNANIYIYIYIYS